MTFREYYAKVYIFRKLMLPSLNGCNFLNIGDIWTFQKKKLKLWIMIMSTTLAFSADAYIKMCGRKLHFF